MVNTEPYNGVAIFLTYYNILNIVVNTELVAYRTLYKEYYNILNIVVNTEPKRR